MNSQVFKLKGRLYTLTAIKLLSTDLKALNTQLEDLLNKAPKLFHQAPIVIDCSEVPNEQLDFGAICESLRAHHLMPVAVQGVDANTASTVEAYGLGVIHATSQDKDMLSVDTASPTASDAYATKLLTTPLRSGQQAVSKEGDLVITASVSHGAELLADGNIYVFGTLRGRALAGISGKQSARIFCLALDAELVSIAGFYRVSDSIEKIDKPCQIYLQDGHIHIEQL